MSDDQRLSMMVGVAVLLTLAVMSVPLAIATRDSATAYTLGYAAAVDSVRAERVRANEAIAPQPVDTVIIPLDFLIGSRPGYLSFRYVPYPKPAKKETR